MIHTSNRVRTSAVAYASRDHTNAINGERRSLMQGVVSVDAGIEHGQKCGTPVIEARMDSMVGRYVEYRTLATHILNSSRASCSGMIFLVTTTVAIRLPIGNSTNTILNSRTVG